MLTQVKVKFKHYNCQLDVSRYQVNSSPALTLYGTGNYTGEVIARCTVCIESYMNAGNTVLIKNYSENEGMMQALINAGIGKDTGHRQQVGFVELQEMVLFTDIVQLINEVPAY